MKIVFVDTEYTGEHAFTTLVSIGLVTLDGKELYVTLNDYARDQVTDWLKDNVLRFIDHRQSVSKKDACELISRFLETYSEGKNISLVSAGKVTDLILLFQLWHSLYPEKKYFHSLYDLPGYLRHRVHLDLDTLFFAAGVDENVDREVFVGNLGCGIRHHALYDARIVRECFLKLVRDGNLPSVSNKLLDQALSG